MKSFFSALIFLFLPIVTWADLKLDITKGNLNPLPIAVLKFQGKTAEEIKYGKDLSEIISANLKKSGLFNPIRKKAYNEIDYKANQEPDFKYWKTQNVEALLVGETVFNSYEELEVIFRLWGLFPAEEMLAFKLSAPKKNWRKMGHRISDLIYERLTGEKGYFDTQIVFISETGSKTNRKKRLTIMDQDGVNKHYLTSGNYLVLTPRFSPSNRAISYISYETGTPQIFLYDLDRNSRGRLGKYEGMAFSPRFSPDGKKICITLERNGNSDIYIVDLESRELSRLTKNPSIDTSPSFSPDGKKIVFNSDRGGSPQLYTLDLVNHSIQRISFGEGRYLTPVWSPRGDLIAFTKNQKGKFYIGVLKTGHLGQERLLTEAFFVEGPTWSPNGRVLMFTLETPGKQGYSEIWSIDIMGNNLQKIKTGGGASDPSWSPLLN